LEVARLTAQMLRTGCGGWPFHNRASQSPRHPRWYRCRPAAEM